MASHKLDKQDVGNIIRELCFEIDTIAYGGPRSFMRPDLKDDEIIDFTHFTHDFFERKAIMYIPFIYDNYKIRTWYLNTDYLIK